MKARVPKTNPIRSPKKIGTPNQEDMNQLIVDMLNGEGAELFCSIDPDNGRIQVLQKLNSIPVACLMLVQIIEEFSKKGIPHNLIRESVETGLAHHSRH